MMNTEYQVIDKGGDTYEVYLEDKPCMLEHQNDCILSTCNIDEGFEIISVDMDSSSDSDDNSITSDNLNNTTESLLTCNDIYNKGWTDSDDSIDESTFRQEIYSNLDPNILTFSKLLNSNITINDSYMENSTTNGDSTNENSSDEDSVDMLGEYINNMDPNIYNNIGESNSYIIINNSEEIEEEIEEEINNHEEEINNHEKIEKDPIVTYTPTDVIIDINNINRNRSKRQNYQSISTSNSSIGLNSDYKYCVNVLHSDIENNIKELHNNDTNDSFNYESNESFLDEPEEVYWRRFINRMRPVFDCIYPCLLPCLNRNEMLCNCYN